MISARIITEYAGKQTLDVLSRLIEERNKYFQESVEQSTAAVAITALKSIRASTRKAKKAGKVEVKESTELCTGFKKQGSRIVPCIKYRGTNNEFKKGQKDVHIKWHKESLGNIKNSKVFLFKLPYGNPNLRFVIVAPSINDAQNIAKDIVQGRINQYGGLAKLAWSMLMYKTNNKETVKERPTKFSEDTAKKFTKYTEYVTKTGKDRGIYTLELDDLLNYALGAIRGGESAIDVALKKSANKAVSNINAKAKRFFDNVHLETPFPEVVSRKKKV